MVKINLDVELFDSNWTHTLCLFRELNYYYYYGPRTNKDHLELSCPF